MSTLREKNRPHRVEAFNWKGKWDLIGIGQSIGMAHFIARDNDDYYVRIVECSKRKKEVWRNFDVDTARIRA